MINCAAAQDAEVQVSPDVSTTKTDGLSVDSKTSETNSTKPEIPDLPEVKELSEDDLKLVANFNRTDFEVSMQSLRAVKDVLSNVNDVNQLDEYEKRLYTKGKPLVEEYLNKYEAKTYESLTDKEKFILIAFMAGLMKVQQELAEWKLTHKDGNSIVANKAVGIDSDSWEDDTSSHSDEDDDSAYDENDDDEDENNDYNGDETDENDSDDFVHRGKHLSKPEKKFRPSFPQPPFRPPQGRGTFNSGLNRRQNRS